MKKYGLMFKLAFLSYFAVMAVAKYVTARLFADVIFWIFIICCVYQIVYVIWLRKKENVKFKTAINELLRYAFLTPIVYLILYRIVGLIAGFFKKNADHHHIDVYYSLSDMICDGWANLTLLIVAVPFIIYIIIYLIVKLIVKVRSDKK